MGTGELDDTGRPAGRRRLLFGAVTALTTAIDVGLFLALAAGAGVAVVLADLAAIATASLVSFTLHRRSTLASHPYFRWVRDPLGFALLAAMAGLLDAIVLGFLVGFADPTDPALTTLVGAKFVSLVAAIVLRAFGYRYVLHPLVVEARHRRDAPLTDGSLRFSVVVPAYGAEAVIAHTVSTLQAALADVHADGGLEIIVVDDGSDDATSDVAVTAGADQVLTLPVNRGKGAAVRAGMRASRGRVVAFTDADLAYDPPHLRRLLAEVEAGWDVVIGNRQHPDSVVTRANGLRALGSRVVNRLSAVVLLAAPRDTQCGLKGFRGDVARTLFAHARVDGFAFDIEVLHLVERAGWSLLEIPVRVDESEGSSTVNVSRDVIALSRDLVRVRRWATAGAYDAIGEIETSV